MLNEMEGVLLVVNCVYLWYHMYIYTTKKTHKDITDITETMYNHNISNRDRLIN